MAQFIALTIAQLAALLALASQPVVTWEPEFSQPLIERCDPVLDVAFVGCTAPGGDETDYAGLIWLDGQIAPQVGP